MVDPTNRPRSPVGLRVCASIDRASPPLSSLKRWTRALRCCVDIKLFLPSHTLSTQALAAIVTEGASMTLLPRIILLEYGGLSACCCRDRLCIGQRRLGQRDYTST